MIEMLEATGTADIATAETRPRPWDWEGIGWWRIKYCFIARPGLRVSQGNVYLQLRTYNIN